MFYVSFLFYFSQNVWVFKFLLSCEFFLLSIVHGLRSCLLVGFSNIIIPLAIRQCAAWSSTLITHDAFHEKRKLFNYWFTSTNYCCNYYLVPGIFFLLFFSCFTVFPVVSLLDCHLLLLSSLTRTVVGGFTLRYLSDMPWCSSIFVGCCSLTLSPFPLRPQEVFDHKKKYQVPGY